MAPAIITIDPNDSSVFAATNGTGPSRTLLLAPPSLAAHADNLTAVVSQYDRSVTDLHMIDRISAGLVSLPEAKYDAILVLADAAGSVDEAVALLTRSVFGTVAEALKPEGTLSAQSGLNLGATALAKEAILAGLVGKGSGFEKPDYGASEGVVSLKLGSKKKKAPAPAPAPAGVGFDFGDDLDDDDIIDEETLMTEEDLKRPINIRTSHHPCHIIQDLLANMHFLQPPSASPSPASAARPARTARAA